MGRLGDLKIRISAELRDFSRAIGRVKSGIGKLGSGLTSLPALAAVGGAGFAANELIKVADAYVNLDARLTSLLGTSQEAAEVQEELFQMSQRTGSAVLDNATSFTKLSIASKMTGLTATENLEVLEGLNKVFAISGASALDTSISMRQLGQALASGRLQGDEFRSMAESTPMLLVKLSEQLNVGVGDLKEMGSEGELTSDILGKAFLNIARSGDVAFTELPKTSARAFQRIINSAQKLWDHVNDNTGLIDYIADSFDDVATWIEQNEYRFIEWAQNIKKWLTENGPGIKEGIKEIFNQTFELVKAVGPEVKRTILAMADGAKIVLPWIAKIIESLVIAVKWWKKYFEAQRKLRTEADLETLSRGVGPEWENEGDKGDDIGFSGQKSAQGRATGSTVINNNITEKFNRSDLARLNTDQTRQLSRA